MVYDQLLPGIIGQLFAKVWVIYETTWTGCFYICKFLVFEILLAIEIIKTFFHIMAQF